ncbi:MAG: GTP-binding protein [Rhodoglobus sp.]
MSEHSGLAVTLISGLRGAGKSTVASLLTGEPSSPARESVAGDAHPDAQTLAFTLADHLVDLAVRGHRGDVVVELPAQVDPAEVALLLEQIFTESSTSETASLALRELITIVRAADIRRLLFREGPELSDDDYDTSEQLAAHIEFSTAIVLSGTEQCAPQQLREIYGLLTKLNPTAAIVTLATASRLRRRRRPSLCLAADLGRRMGWTLELSGRAGFPTTVNSISTAVFCDPRPFHPERLAIVIDSCLEPQDVGLVLRSRGLVRLASRPEEVGEWTSAGGILALNPTGMSSWSSDSPIGQELVFIGQNLQPERIFRALRSALLGDKEMIAGPMEWASYRDTFPSWQSDHSH